MNVGLLTPQIRSEACSKGLLLKPVGSVSMAHGGLDGCGLLGLCVILACEMRDRKVL